jgi:hypothetical protein
VTLRPPYGAYVETLDPEDDDRYTVEEFNRMCNQRLLIDYDGYGHPVRNGCMDPHIDVRPSNRNLVIPLDATHVVWFNR